MTLAKPITEKNAIDAITFAVVLERHFNAHEAENLLRLENTLRDKLPSFSRMTGVSFRVENDHIAEQTPKATGVLLQHFKPDGKPDWVLRAVDNQIAVTCHAYTRWDDIWLQADSFITEAFKAIGTDASNNAVAFVLQVVDRFVQPNRFDEYSVADVFDARTKFLTPHAAEVGPLWHVHQGWFADLELLDRMTLRCLHVLNISTSQVAEKFITTIDHVSQLSLANTGTTIDSSSPVTQPDESAAFRNQAFQRLHDENKKILRSLLNADQCTAIGLA